MTREEVYKDITDTLGLVPSWIASVPDEFLAEEWELMKRLEFSETVIPNKYKELIGVAVSAAMKCRYCEAFHTESAKLHGASDQEIREAAYVAKASTGWSTYIHGMQTDFDQFMSELHQIKDYVEAKQKQQMAA